MKTIGNRLLRWTKRHKNGMNGAICIAVSLVLMVSLAVMRGKVTLGNSLVSSIAIIIAVYAFARGIFTIVFDYKENELGTVVYQHVLVELYNQLLFVYERMLWIWVILPIIIIGCLVFIEDLETRKWMVVVLGALFVALSALFSKGLLHKRKQLRNRIKEIENDLGKTNASSCQTGHNQKRN